MFEAVADIFSTIVMAIKIGIIVIVLFLLWSIFRKVTRRSREAKRFPPIDERGRQLTQTASFTLSGVNHIHDNSDPQDVFSSGIPPKSPLTLCADPQNRFDDHAIKVFFGDKYIGWIPNSDISAKDRQTKNLIFDLLISGETIQAQFDGYNHIKVYDQTSDDDYGLDEDDDDASIEGEDNYTWYKTADVLCAIYGNDNNKA